MRDATIIRSFQEQELQRQADAQKQRELRSALGRFLEMPFRERLGWLMFGSAWLVRRWSRQQHDDSTRRGPRPPAA